MFCIVTHAVCCTVYVRYIKHGGRYMCYCADQKRTNFSLAMPCLRHSEQRPDSPSSERENYFEFNGRYVGFEFIPDNVHFTVSSALKNDRRVRQKRTHHFYRVSILSCPSVWDVYRTFYRTYNLYCPSVWEVYRTCYSVHFIWSLSLRSISHFLRVSNLSCPSVWGVNRTC